MMIAEEYLSRSQLFRRLKSGPHGQLIELYRRSRHAEFQPLSGRHDPLCFVYKTEQRRITGCNTFPKRGCF
jgi:hypothetical protein